MKQQIILRVNGDDYDLLVEPRRLLIDALRDDLSLTGTKRGCEEGICGCCTVLLDGQNVKSCLTLALQARGHLITTIEGLKGPDGFLHPIQEAFVRNSALQCGYCTPGFIMTTKALLDQNTAPAEGEIREALSGHICRCTGYVKIVETIVGLSQGHAMSCPLPD
jgi:carbon-monoxide dehydrogenase small subunit